MGLEIVPVFDIIIPLIRDKGIRSICMIGKQSIDFSMSDFQRCASRFGFEYDNEMADTMASAQTGEIDSHAFFRMLGVKEVHSLDYSDYEGADIIVNLNEDDIPDEYADYFDLVIDGGTLEHVFDQRRAIKSMDRLACGGGMSIILCLAPGMLIMDFTATLRHFLRIITQRREVMI